jgi:hypothetical protein
VATLPLTALVAAAAGAVGEPPLKAERALAAEASAPDTPANPAPESAVALPAGSAAAAEAGNVTSPEAVAVDGIPGVGAEKALLNALCAVDSTCSNWFF